MLKLFNKKTIGNKYKIIRELGSGGQGKVYLVNKNNKKYALKIIERPSREAFLRFRKEVNTLKRINHPNVIKIVLSKITKPQNKNYYIMEYAKYGTLQDHNYYINEVAICLRLFKKICLGIKAIHDKGILHRDIKPKNILLVNDEKDVKVSDFGLAYELDKTNEEITQIREKVGTNYFSPPEQTSLPPNPTKRSDIFALGRILYYLITGHKVLSLEEKLSVRGFINSKISVKIDRLINKMCAFEPKKRFGDVSEVVREVNKL